jgi:hypothetical protein
MGLKKVLISSFCLSFIGMLFLIINGQGAGQFLISLYVLGSKFGISSTFNMAYLGNPMLFPTEVLSISFGACNIFARVSTILAPFVAELKPEVISQWIFCSVVMLALLASFLLKISKSQNKQE